MLLTKGNKLSRIVVLPLKNQPAFFRRVSAKPLRVSSLWKSLVLSSCQNKAIWYLKKLACSSILLLWQTRWKSRTLQNQAVVLLAIRSLVPQEINLQFSPVTTNPLGIGYRKKSLCSSLLRLAQSHLELVTSRNKSAVLSSHHYNLSFH